MLFRFADEIFRFTVGVLGDVQLAVVDADGVAHEDVFHADSLTNTSAEEDAVQVAIEKFDGLVARIEIEQEIFVVASLVFGPFGEEGQLVAVIVLWLCCHGSWSL